MFVGLVGGDVESGRGRVGGVGTMDPGLVWKKKDGRAGSVDTQCRTQGDTGRRDPE